MGTTAIQTRQLPLLANQSPSPAALLWGQAASETRRLTLVLARTLTEKRKIPFPIYPASAGFFVLFSGDILHIFDKRLHMFIIR
jgi:hypothetical protein